MIGEIVTTLVAALFSPGPAEAPVSAYGMRPLIQGERSIIAVAQCKNLVPIYQGADWCKVLSDGCRPDKIWVMDQTRRGSPLELHQTNGDAIPIPIPPWCSK